MILGDLSAPEREHLHLGQGVAPLAADGLAPAGGQGPQKGVEVRIAGVFPVVLLALAHGQAPLAQPGPLVGGGEVDVQARGFIALAELQAAPQQHEPGLLHVHARPHQQPGAGGGGEGRRRQQLRIVLAPRPLIGVGPGVVEDVFALAVGLQIERHHRRHPARLVLHRQVLRAPTSALHRAAGLLGDIQEVVGHEGIAGGRGAGLPGLTPDLGDAAAHGERRLQGRRHLGPPPARSAIRGRWIGAKASRRRGSKRSGVSQNPPQSLRDSSAKGRGNGICSARQGLSQKPLPRAGRGLGWGCWRGEVQVGDASQYPRIRSWRPHTQPSPREGERAFRANALFAR